MGRSKRPWVHQNFGSNHLISRIVGGDFLLGAKEKEYFVKLMFKLAKGFYIGIHSYTIMSNHFHILATGLSEDASKAGKDELIKRYRMIYGKKAEYPEGSYKSNGELIPDDDGGIERLRKRLGSISRYIQELKQTFSKWYNCKYDRKGYLWSNRFDSIIMEKGEPELICSAYIDLNSVRAGIVKKPEAYRWSSIGLRVRDPKKWEKLLTKINIDDKKTIITVDKKSGYIKRRYEIVKKEISFPLYRSFLYKSGCKEVEGKANIQSEVYKDAMKLNGKLGIGDLLRYRFRNLSEGIGIGSYRFIEQIQIDLDRKFIKPRSIINKDNETKFYSTRNLKPI